MDLTPSARIERAESVVREQQADESVAECFLASTYKGPMSVVSLADFEALAEDLTRLQRAVTGEDVLAASRRPSPDDSPFAAPPIQQIDSPRRRSADL